MSIGQCLGWREALTHGDFVGLNGLEGWGGPFREIHLRLSAGDLAYRAVLERISAEVCCPLIFKCSVVILVGRSLSGSRGGMGRSQAPPET